MVFTNSFQKVIVIGLVIMLSGINPAFSSTDYVIEESTKQPSQDNTIVSSEDVLTIESDITISDGVKSRILLYDSFDSLDRAAESLSKEKIQHKYHIMPALTTTKISRDEIPIAGLLSYIDNTKSITTAVDQSGAIGNKFEGYDLETTGRNIGIDALHELGLTGAGVTVAVIDSGIKADLPSFINNGVQRVQEWSVPGIPELADFGDISNHATHVAGILGGNGIYHIDNNDKQYDSTGMAPDVTLHSLRVLDATGFGENDWVVQGIEKAIDLDVDIMSLSLSSELYNGSSDIHQIAINKAVQQGIVVVAAAGNLGPLGSGIGVPGALEETISVGAADFLESGLIGTYQLSGIGPRVNDYPSPDLIAPGVDILSVDKETGGVRADTGTSMATPHVSGGIALLIEAFPNATVSQIREAILAGAVEMSASEPVEKVGRGIIDFEAAYNILANTTNIELNNSTFAMSSAPRVIKDENFVFRHQISGETKTLPFFIHSSRNVTLKPMVDENEFITKGVEFQLPQTLEIKEGLNKFSMNITVTSTNIEFIGGRIFFEDNITKTLLQYANISYFAFVKYPQARILFDSSKDFDTNSRTYFAAHSPVGQFSYFAKLLEIDGHKVDEHRNGSITSALLSPYDMLIIANPDLFYTQAEITSIRNFVYDEGKALLIIAGGGLMSAETSRYDRFNAITLDEILDGSGLSFKKDSDGTAYTSIIACSDLAILDRFANCYSDAETIKSQEILPKLKEFPHYGPPLTTNSVGGVNVQSLAKSDKETVIASSEILSNNGRILLFSSPLLFDNKGLLTGYGTNGDLSNNKQISTDAISWLLEPKSVNIDYWINGKTIENEANVNLHETLTIEFKVTDPNGQLLQLNVNQLSVSIVQRDPDFPFPLFGTLIFEKTVENTFIYETSLEKFGDYEFFVFITDPSENLISSNGHMILTAVLENFDDQEEINSLGTYLFFALMATWVLFIYNEGGRKRFLKRKEEEEELAK